MKKTYTGSARYDKSLVSVKLTFGSYIFIYYITLKVAISEFGLSVFNANRFMLLKSCGICMIIGGLEANKMHLKTNCFVYKVNIVNRPF